MIGRHRQSGWDDLVTKSKSVQGATDRCQKIVRSPFDFNFYLKPWWLPHDMIDWSQMAQHGHPLNLLKYLLLGSFLRYVTVVLGK